MNTALKNLRRSPYQTFAAIFVISLTMFVLGLFSVVAIGSQTILLTFETKPQVIAYLKDGITQEKVNQLVNTLAGSQGVKKAVYISKQDALELYKKSVGNDPLLLGTVTDWGIVTADILPASVEVTATNPNSFKDISSILDKSDIVSTTPQGKKEIDFPQDVVIELEKWTNAIRIAGLILVAALALVSVLSIVIIISMKVAGRRLEINTLKLIGARNFFIIKPYLIESLVYGFFGSLLGWLLTVIVILYSTPFLSVRLDGIINFPLPLIVYLLLWAELTLFGLVLSIFSGYFAASRFVNRSK